MAEDLYRIVTQVQDNIFLTQKFADDFSDWKNSPEHEENPKPYLTNKSYIIWEMNFSSIFPDDSLNGKNLFHIRFTNKKRSMETPAIFLPCMFAPEFFKAFEGKKDLKDDQFIGKPVIVFEKYDTNRRMFFPEGFSILTYSHMVNYPPTSKEEAMKLKDNYKSMSWPVEI